MERQRSEGIVLRPRRQAYSVETTETITTREAFTSQHDAIETLEKRRARNFFRTAVIGSVSFVSTLSASQVDFDPKIASMIVGGTMFWGGLVGLYDATRSMSQIDRIQRHINAVKKNETTYHNLEKREEANINTENIYPKDVPTQ